MKIERSVLVLTTILLMAAPLFAQQRTKMCFQLMSYLDAPHAPDAMVDVFIYGSSDATAPAIHAHGGLVKQALPRLVNARVPIATIHALAADPAVERFEFSIEEVRLLNDTARMRSRVNEVHLGIAPLAQGYKGEGVITGIIDTGLDVTHPDFHDENGGTRVLKYWAQHLTGPFEPVEFGYGQVYNTDQINDGTMPATAYQASGHGTSVAGIAAGGGTANGMHAGMAPKADIIAVKISNVNFRAKVADAVKFIFDEAELLGMPAVVNISLGAQMGSHDGLDPAALLIDDLLQAGNGRVVVCAAGNFNEIGNWDEYHLRTQVTSDTSFTWFRYNSQINFGGGIMGGVFLEAWGDAAELENVRFAVGADRVNPGFQYRGRTPFRDLVQNQGTVFTDTLYSFSGNRIGVAHMLALPRGDQYQVQMWMAQPDSNTYNFRFMSTGEGMFDVWAPRNHGVSRMVPHIAGEVALAPTVAEYPPMANYVFPDNFQHITDSWTCSPHVITVGNYRNVTAYVAYDGSWQEGVGLVPGEITPSSSKGPTRDDRIKPDLTAPGDVTFSAFPMVDLANMMNIPSEAIKLAQGGMHIRGGGTSAASPHVAGIAALYLQQCPSASYTEVMQALYEAAVTDSFTGTTPNVQWGNGKVDALDAMISGVLENVELSLIGDNPFCEGEQVILVGPAGFADYEWSTGDTGVQLPQDGPGTVSLIVYNASGCRAFSDTLTLAQFPAPDMPVVTANANVLTSTPAEGYQWLLDGNLIEGAIDQTLEAMWEGVFHVQITDDNGCSAVSDPVLVLSTSIAGLAEVADRIWPSPAREQLNIHTTAEGHTLYTVFDGSGRKVLEQASYNTTHTVLSLTGLNAGTYVLRAENAQGIGLYRFVKLP